VRAFKYLDHDQMVGLRIYMSKLIYLKRYFRPFILHLLDERAKKIQNI